MNYYPITIIDNFLKKPDKFRKFALNQEFYSANNLKNFGGNSTFPGWRSKDLREINADIFKMFFSKVISIFHPDDYDPIHWEIEAYFQTVPKQFQEGVIHNDYNTLLAGILYLHPNPIENSGTSIYKKNSLFNENDFVEGTKLNDYRKNITSPNISYHQMFTQMMSIENVYNRIILYEGNEYHKADHFFGDTINNSRLTLVFFVKNIKANNNQSFAQNRIKAIDI